MKHTYKISGMTCDNCAAKVKSALLKHPDVTGAEVSLNPPLAKVSLQKHISEAELDKAISRAGEYHIVMEEAGHTHESHHLQQHE
jgi:copper chaperone CopZ